MQPRLLALLALLVVAIATDRAAAHAVLRDAEPADGASFVQSPTRLVLSFDEPVTPISVTVVDGAGHAVALATPARAIDTRIEANLPSGLPRGLYVVAWRVTSADSHPVAGALVFAVGTTVPADFKPALTEADRGWLVANIVLRFAVTAAALISGGAAFFALLVAPLSRQLREHLAIIAGLGAGCAVLAIPARGALLLGADGFTAAIAPLWQVGVQSRLGISMVIAAAGFLALAAAWRWQTASLRIAAGCGLVVIASFAVSGHAAVVDPAWLMATLVVLHVAGAAFWLGSLAPLAVALSGPMPASLAVIQRFSRVALVAVGGLATAGAVVAAIQLETTAALEATSYGRTLLAKLLGVTALLTLAAANKLVHTPALEAGDARAVGRLRRAIHWEMAAGGCVLAVTALLSLTPPPRAEMGAELHRHAAETPGIGATATGTRISAIIEVSPGRAGHNRVLVDILDRDGQSFEPRELTFEIAHPDTGVTGLRRALKPRREGGFVLEGPEFAMPGRWKIRLQVLVGDFELETLTTEVTIR